MFAIDRLTGAEAGLPSALEVRGNQTIVCTFVIVDEAVQLFALESSA